MPGLRLGVVQYFNTLQPCLLLVAGVVVLTKLACNSSINALWKSMCKCLSGLSVPTSNHRLSLKKCRTLVYF